MSFEIITLSKFPTASVEDEELTYRGTPPNLDKQSGSLFEASTSEHPQVGFRPPSPSPDRPPGS